MGRLTRKARGASERHEEPVEPVRATTTPPRDTEALDKLLDEIEEVLEPEPAPEPKEIDWATVAGLLKLDNPEDYQVRFLEPQRKPDPTMGEMYRFYREAQEREQEWYQTDPENDLPWDDIAKLPPPGPGGREIVIAEPEEIRWDCPPVDDTTCIRPAVRYRKLLVTRAMWEEARRGRGWRRGPRYGGDNGMCGICGWPLAGEGGPPCGRAGTGQGEDHRERRYPWPAMPIRRPEDVTKIVGNT